MPFSHLKRKMIRFTFRLCCLVATCVILAGCHTVESAFDPARVGPRHAADNHAGIPQLPDAIQRVLLLPISGGSVATEETSAAFDPVFASALQRENRFEVVALTRAECRRMFGADELRSTSALPHGFLKQVRERYAADAVMFVDLTVLRSFRPLSMGIRAKLATTSEEVALVWAFDNVFSADEPEVVNSARRHYLKSQDGMVPVDRSDAILQSPSRYAAYVAEATFATLPNR